MRKGYQTSLPCRFWTQS